VGQTQEVEQSLVGLMSTPSSAKHPRRVLRCGGWATQGPLELREDPEQGAVVAGLKKIEVKSAEKIFSLLREGNARRKVREGLTAPAKSHLQASVRPAYAGTELTCY
jgi:hypothetical protein